MPFACWVILPKSVAGMWNINIFPTTADGGFSEVGYMVAYGVLLILQLIGLIWIWVSQYFFLPPTDKEKVA